MDVFPCGIEGSSSARSSELASIVLSSSSSEISVVVVLGNAIAGLTVTFMLQPGAVL